LVAVDEDKTIFSFESMHPGRKNHLFNAHEHFKSHISSHDGLENVTKSLNRPFAFDSVQP
jgi:hypothetical protein